MRSDTQICFMQVRDLRILLNTRKYFKQQIQQVLALRDAVSRAAGFISATFDLPTTYLTYILDTVNSWSHYELITLSKNLDHTNINLSILMPEIAIKTSECPQEFLFAWATQTSDFDPVHDTDVQDLLTDILDEARIPCFVASGILNPTHLGYLYDNIYQKNSEDDIEDPTSNDKGFHDNNGILDPTDNNKGKIYGKHDNNEIDINDPLGFYASIPKENKNDGRPGDDPSNLHISATSATTTDHRPSQPAQYALTPRHTYQQPWGG